MSRLLALPILLAACVEDAPVPAPEPIEQAAVEAPAPAPATFRSSPLLMKVEPRPAASTGRLGRKESAAGSTNEAVASGDLTTRDSAASSGLLGSLSSQTVSGAGGMGTRGVGTGRSGYGKGGGSFGTRRLVVSAPPVAASELPEVSGTVLTEADPLSTFAIDVDTASFAIARGALDRRTFPAPRTVRVEEFVNALTYAYPPPGAGEGPFAVSMEAAPHPWQPGHHLLRVGVKAAEPPVDRAPVHLTFLVDVSGSMSATDKLPLVKDALAELVDNLDAEDRVALVTYAGRTEVVLPPTRLADKAPVRAAIERLETGGGTAMGSGMQLAFDLAASTLEPGTENRVVVLSDGDANIGPVSHEAILATIEEQAARGITLSTVGFGRSSNDALMEQLADRGDGNYHHIDRRSEARRVFGVHLAGTLRTVARDVKIQVDFAPESVVSYRLLGYENRAIADQDFRNDAVDAGEIGSGHTVTALYDLVLRDAPAERLATVRMRSKPPGPDAPATERSTPLPVAAVKSAFTRATPDFRRAVVAAGFAEKLRHAPGSEELSYPTLSRLLGPTDADDSLATMLRQAVSLTDPVADAR
jgi:Ca-activated chloride channel family protein